MVCIAGLVVEWCGRLPFRKVNHASSSSLKENCFIWRVFSVHCQISLQFALCWISSLLTYDTLYDSYFFYNLDIYIYIINANIIWHNWHDNICDKWHIWDIRHVWWRYIKVVICDMRAYSRPNCIYAMTKIYMW